MFKHILIPTDGSERSDKAATQVMTLAKTLKAKVTAIHVCPTVDTMFYGEGTWADPHMLDRFRESAQAEGNKYLNRVEAAAKSVGVQFERVIIEQGHPWSSIVHVAEQRGCDLIAMASHGRHGLPALVLGSETNKVLAHSKIPVLVYR